MCVSEEEMGRCLCGAMFMCADVYDMALCGNIVRNVARSL